MALIKLGFPYQEVMQMPEAEMEGYLTAYQEAIEGKQKGKTYVVRKGAKKGRPKR